MAATKVTVVICQAQGRNPVKRQMEEDILTALITEPGVDASLVPHLYDMGNDHTGMMFLRSVPGTLVVLGWLYERATQWTLDRAGVRGHEGITLIRSEIEGAPTSQKKTSAKLAELAPSTSQIANCIAWTCAFARTPVTMWTKSVGSCRPDEFHQRVSEGRSTSTLSQPRAAA